MRARAFVSSWGGLIAFLVSLAGTLLLAYEAARPWAVCLLLGAGWLSVTTWGGQLWPPAIASYDFKQPGKGTRERFYLLGVIVAFLLALSGGFRYLAAPNDTFGFAGILWLTSITVLVGSAVAGSKLPAQDARKDPWTDWELICLAGLLVLALSTRVWDLTGFPDNIYPDEIMTGTIATQAYLNQSNASPSVFSTVWHDIELPALWFWLVSLCLKIGGTTLAMLRFPAALFGAITVVPFYGLVREVWGRTAAFAGSVILAVSASNVHYSRLGLNNIVPQFFWAGCFLFLLRGLRSRRPIDWVLAGLSAGLSEYFYYATRLLPFILLLFIGYISILRWRELRSWIISFLLLGCGFFVGMGPLLFQFIRKPGLYLGRGTSLLLGPSHLVLGRDDFQTIWKAIWSAICQNLLGITTYSSQDIIYFAPLLRPAEGALLILGVALLVWHWRHPAAFLMLTAGLGVLIIGGILVANPGSVPPLINHWTPAFPIFYIALSLPIGVWASHVAELPVKRQWVGTLVLVLGLLVLGWINLNFYFRQYYANPENLRSSRYRMAQEIYEIQNAQGRFQASLGADCHVFNVGQSSAPYDSTLIRYLIAGQEWTGLTNPAVELPTIHLERQNMAFLFFPGNEQFRELTNQLYPGGVDHEVKSRSGKHLFYAYLLSNR